MGSVIHTPEFRVGGVRCPGLNWLTCAQVEVRLRCYPPQNPAGTVGVASRTPTAAGGSQYAIPPGAEVRARRRHDQNRPTLPRSGGARPAGWRRSASCMPPWTRIVPDAGVGQATSPPMAGSACPAKSTENTSGRRRKLRAPPLAWKAVRRRGEHAAAGPEHGDAEPKVAWSEHRPPETPADAAPGELPRRTWPRLAGCGTSVPCPPLGQCGSAVRLQRGMRPEGRYGGAGDGDGPRRSAQGQGASQTCSAPLAQVSGLRGGTRRHPPCRADPEDAPFPDGSEKDRYAHGRHCEEGIMRPHREAASAVRGMVESAIQDAQA